MEPVLKSVVKFRRTQWPNESIYRPTVSCEYHRDFKYISFLKFSLKSTNR